MIVLLLLRDLIGLPAKPRPVAASRRPAPPKSVPANTIPTHTNERCKRGATIMAARQGSHLKPLLFATQSLAPLQHSRRPAKKTLVDYIRLPRRAPGRWAC